MIDYKISVEEYDDKGGIVYQKVRFYEGEMVMVPTPQQDFSLLDVEEYKRHTLLNEVEYTYE